MMEALVAVCVGALVAAAVYLMLRPRSFTLVLGLSLLSYAVNLFLFASGRLGERVEPIVGEAAAAAGGAAMMDPLPQALVLTAIVIGLAMIAILLALALRVRSECESDRVDAEDVAA